MGEVSEFILKIEEVMVSKKSRRQVGQIHLQLYRHSYLAGFRIFRPRSLDEEGSGRWSILYCKSKCILDSRRAW